MRRTPTADVREIVEIDGGIVVGHDGSKHTQNVLQWAAGLAARADLNCTSSAPGAS